MQQPTVYFVGAEAEVEHHAAPLRAQREVLIVSAEEAPTRTRPGDLAIFFSEHFDRFRECIRRLRENSVATIYAIDGILEWRNLWTQRRNEPACPWTMRPALSHKIACIGRHQARLLNAWGNQGRTEVIGIPRLDSEAARISASSKDGLASSEGDFRLLVMTAKFPAFTAEQRTITIHSLRELRDWIRANPKVNSRRLQVTWRLPQDLAHELDVSSAMSDVRGQELAEQLDRVDALITTPSTAILEGMIRDLPVATLDYHNVPPYVVPAWTIGNAEAIGPVLGSLMNPPAERMLFQQTVLRDELECDGSATERMGLLIRQMLSQAAECLRNDQPLMFPAQLVAVTPENLGDYSAEALFPKYEAFRDFDVGRLQAETAHSRREIENLHAQIQQLRMELGEAHEIFDQIHRHPVVGPLVRLRQRLIDSIQKWTKRNSASSSNEAASTAPPQIP